MSDVITMRVEKVDPEKAAELLATNQGNRNLSKSAVGKMASDMKNGLWVYDGSPIRISSTGALLDGQHRLNAVIQSGLPQGFLIIRGLPDEVMKTMDQGRKRTSADAWKMVGGVNGVPVAAGVKSCIRYVKRNPGSTYVWTPQGAPSQAEVNEYMLEYREWIEEVLARTPIGQTPMNKASLIALALLVDVRSAHKDKWEEFFDVLRTGLGDGEDDPRVALRNYAIRGTGRRMGDFEAQLRLAIYIKAWNAYVSDRQLRRCGWRIEEGMPGVL